MVTEALTLHLQTKYAHISLLNFVSSDCEEKISSEKAYERRDEAENDTNYIKYYFDDKLWENLEIIDD